MHSKTYNIRKKETGEFIMRIAEVRSCLYFEAWRGTYSFLKQLENHG